jgi:hypothetical protein
MKLSNSIDLSLFSEANSFWSSKDIPLSFLWPEIPLLHVTVACHWFLFLANCTLYEVHIVTSRFYHIVWCVSSRALICSSIIQTVHSRQALRNFSCPHACNMPHPCHSLLFTCLAYLFNRLTPSPWGRVSVQSSIAGTLAMIWSRLEA